MDLINIFKAFHPKAGVYAYFQSTHGTFSKLDLMLGQKISLSISKKIKIISSIISHHNAMKLGINHKKKKKKNKDKDAK